MRDTNVNLIELSHVTREVVDRLNRNLAYQDIEIVIQNDSAEEMEENVNLIKELALTGSILAVLILWFFMRNVRLITIVMVSIPVSILVAFNFFYAFDISLNSLTLVGMVLAVGMLLDNSVVVLENIYRHLSLHKDRTTAVIRGTHEVWRSITAATLTTITVFLPFIFSDDYLIEIMGEHVGVSIIATLLISLLVALLLIPMLTHSMLGTMSGRPVLFNTVSQTNRLFQIYTLLLKSAMRFPARTVFSVVVVFFFSIALCIALSMNVPREVDLREFNLYVTMPSGSTLETTDDTVREFESTLTDIEEIQDVVATIYEDEAVLTIVLQEDYEELQDRTIPQIKTQVEGKADNFSAADISLSAPSGSARFGGRMGRNPTASFERMFGIGSQQDKVQIKGSDFPVLRKVAEDIEYYLDEMETVSRASTNLSGNRPEIHLLFDHQLLSRNDIPLTSVNAELASFENEVTSGIRYKQGTDEYDITIRNTSYEEDKTFDDLRALRVPNQSAAAFELDQISRIIYSYGLSSIKRLNQEKQIDVSFSFESEITDSKDLLEASREEIKALIAALAIPAGVAVEVVYDESEFDEFYFLIGAAFILIFMILASVFESLLTPAVMMFTIPLATIGSLWALILTENSLFNANALIGFLILLGVVVNNGIILIDYSNILRRRGYSRSRALMTAGQARVRPILITAITTIVAMMPLAMGQVEYVSRIGASFAITVIGGLAMGTLFTLIFIPTVYSGLENTLDWLRGLPWQWKLLQAGMFTAACGFIYCSVDDVFWQLGYLVFAVLAVPGLTWFFTTSLRQARADLLRPDEALRITVRRVVKVYDDYSRFVREWKKGERVQQARDGAGQAASLLDRLPWQIPVLAFLVYFVYFYLSSRTWLFLLSFLIYFFLLNMWKPVAAYLERHTVRTGKRWYRAIGRTGTFLTLWGFPLASLGIFHSNDFRGELLAFIGGTWFAALFVHAMSNRIHRRKINIARLTGRFAGIRTHLYRLVMAIPVIGKKKNPFPALGGVSLEITSGMFGLLGPNGAGKTTIMRIICGLLDQSRGTIWINGLNVLEKREELLGLIGYLPQEFGSYENMTAHNFLDYIAILKSIYNTREREERVEYVLKAVHLDEHRNRKIGSFSGGMKQRMGIAMTLLHLPRILVVDEPTAGLDPRERIRFRNLMVELSRERIVIFSTHIIEDISSSCNRVAVLEKGRLYYLGTPRNMTTTAEGKVWQFFVAPEEFTGLRDTLRIVHHMRVEERIRVRCLSATPPHAGAEQVPPTLEDSYLWLLGKKTAHAV